MIDQARLTLRRCLTIAPSLLGCVVTAACQPKEGDDKPLDWRLIELNRDVSRFIDKTAEKIDLYAANAATSDKPNRSQVILHNSASIQEHGKRTYSPHASLKFDTPNLREKLQLRFTTYDEDVTERGINENRYTTTPQERTYGTSLALFRDLGEVRTEFRPMVEYTSRLQTSYLFKFSSEAKRGTFTLEPEAQLFARSDTGTGEFFGLNFEFQLSKANNLLLINEEQYTDGDNTMLTNHGIKWTHEYNSVMTHVNSLIFESTNRSVYHLDKCTFSTSFRHRLYKNVLHYSVSPYLTFAKDVAFRPAAALDLNVDIIF